MALPSFFAPGAFFRFDKSVHFSYDVIYCIRRRDAIKAATQQRMAQMKDKMARRDAWETGKGGSKPGYFHALRVNGERMGYPAWLYFGAIATAAVVMIMPVVLLVAFADRLGVWWAILLLLYLATLVVIHTKIVYPREMARMRFILGDEAFFLVYPEEKKKELKRREREKRRQERRVRR